MEPPKNSNSYLKEQQQYPKSLTQLQTQKQSAKYQAINKNIYIQGNLYHGDKCGEWIEIDGNKGIIKKFYYAQERSGAICWDGTKSYSTGRGTCSHHGGVREWTYRTVCRQNNENYQSLSEKIAAIKKQAYKQYDVKLSPISTQSQSQPQLLAQDQSKAQLLFIIKSIQSKKQCELYKNILASQRRAIEHKNKLITQLNLQNSKLKQHQNQSKLQITKLEDAIVQLEKNNEQKQIQLAKILKQHSKLEQNYDKINEQLKQMQSKVLKYNQFMKEQLCMKINNFIKLSQNLQQKSQQTELNIKKVKQQKQKVREQQQVQQSDVEDQVEPQQQQQQLQRQQQQREQTKDNKDIDKTLPSQLNASVSSSTIYPSLQT